MKNTVSSALRMREHIGEEREGRLFGEIRKKVKAFWEPRLPFDRIEHTVKGRIQQTPIFLSNSCFSQPALGFLCELVVKFNAV